MVAQPARLRVQASGLRHLGILHPRLGVPGMYL
jgi:hypothetical protein